MWYCLTQKRCSTTPHRLTESAHQNIDGELLPEIGYHINKKYWRRGFAKKAARACRAWAFSNI
ncbi:MAG: GNAT family N-acetyltransferase [Spirochaetaceae bacterium]|nr:GNAT family N-acetyltransferase [Spirochaetaceae bacterium]